MKLKPLMFFCFLSVYVLFPSLSYGINSTNFPTLEDEYNPQYCLQLEAAYGNGLMSEGGFQSIDLMFDQISMNNTKALDIGSGLGGVAFYLADKYNMHITGLEVNSWMVTESNKRTPQHLLETVKFILSSSNSHWPLPTESFDIIYSKGVLTHVKDKNELFQECRRLLKNDGLLVITDWLSSDRKKWGENIARLVELENLALYAESEVGYVNLLINNGFTLLSVRDDSADSRKYNMSIVDKLKDPKLKSELSNYYTDEELEAAIIGYESIVKAIEDEELKVFRFVARSSDIN